MASPLPKTTSGKIYDPVFLFMLAAVVLAVGSSFMLRAAVSGFAPSSAQAAGLDPPSTDAKPPHRQFPPHDRAQ